MTWTRLSLYYLATYLPIAGVALLVAPGAATKLLLSNGTYDEVFTRLAGALLLALAALVIQIVRHRVEVLYTTTLFVRLGLLAVMVYLYATTSDPFFVVLFGIIGFGVVLTTIGYVHDHRLGAVPATDG